MKEKPRIAFQLYSARSLPVGETVLTMLEETGYRQVETYGPWHDDPQQTRKLADRHRLTIPSAHISFAMIRDESSRVIEIAQTLGIRLVVAPYLSEQERPDSAKAWRKLAHELNDHAAAFQSHGLSLAWHNHDFEFEPTKDGAVPMSLMLDEAPDLRWEMDVGWTMRTGQDPLAWITRYGHRIAALHVKDIARPGSEQAAEGWCSVGSGSVGWTEILKAAQDSVEYLVVEHDNPPDPAAFAATSFCNLQKILKPA